jgi:hypothetical protein
MPITSCRCGAASCANSTRPASNGRPKEEPAPVRSGRIAPTSLLANCFLRGTEGSIRGSNPSPSSRESETNGEPVFLARGRYSQDSRWRLAGDHQQSVTGEKPANDTRIQPIQPIALVEPPRASDLGIRAVPLPPGASGFRKSRLFRGHLRQLRPDSNKSAHSTVTLSTS